MLSEDISLKEVLVSLESVLRIEYSDANTQETLDNAVARIENTYNIDLNKDLFSLQAENQLISSQINVFLRDIVESLKQMTLYTSLTIFHKSVGISMVDVNYLGFGKLYLNNVFRYLQDDALLKKHPEIIEPLTKALDNIPLGHIKRLFTCLLMFYRLGVYEGVGLIAQYLYLGGLVV